MLNGQPDSNATENSGSADDGLKESGGKCPMYPPSGPRGKKPARATGTAVPSIAPAPISE